MRIQLLHRSTYEYAQPVALGPHQVRLRPTPHARAHVESYGLHAPPEATLRWQQDPAGNHVAHLTFPVAARLPRLELLVELAVEIRPVNPFDFFLDDRCKEVPFAYPPAVSSELAPCLVQAGSEQDDGALRGGPLLTAFLEALPTGGPTVDVLVALNRAVHQRIRYVVREEAGLYTPEETLAQGRGSCRDQAVLLVAALRSRGLAARFASGYLVQLADEGMIPDQPKGVLTDVADLHAWAEVYLPGAGWIGLDSTSGLFCGEGHIPLACAANPALATPVEGTADLPAHRVTFTLSLARLGHEPRPTAPFTDETWAAPARGGRRRRRPPRRARPLADERGRADLHLA